MNEEKPLEATPARIARARREGNVVRSGEFVAGAAFGAAAIAACAVAAPLAGLASDALYAAARGASPRRQMIAMLAFGLVPALAGALAAASAGIAQGGGLRLIGLRIKAERLDPVEGLRRILSRETIANALRATLAFAAAIAVLVPAISRMIGAAAGASGVEGVALAAWAGARRTLFVAGTIGLLFAAAEYAVLRGGWLRKLRMSFEEHKREIKEQEGDPHARGRRRALRRELLRGSLSRVREAAFVIANPSHVAIALGYRPPVTPVPVVLVRAAEEAALRVRALAAQAHVPVIENAALARALFRDAQPGRPIPFEHYVAVAEVVVALVRAGALDAS
ncbi:MAG TPA: EscU/YscU/HrcU family type III secretion system export apparatus switch protein [Candidatus Tyrphobacter sp.]